MNLKIVFALIPLIFASIIAQEQANDTLSIKSDTVCYKIKFNTGDTLIYNVISFDSVVINYGDPLIKQRIEQIRYICDSIQNGKYFLNSTLIGYKCIERNKDTDNVERNESPWMGRKVWFSLDSVGNRYSLGYDDSTKAALCPGGAFQPQLFFPFGGESCRPVDKTWIVESLDELVENGLPLPLVRQSSLLRAVASVDTLNEHCNRFNYIKTAQGSYKLLTAEDTMRVTNIITGYGVLDISTDKNIPVHYYATEEQKLSISIGSKEPMPGWHYIASFYTLVDYKHAVILSPVKEKRKK